LSAKCSQSDRPHNGGCKLQEIALPYQMLAERDNEKVQSRKIGVLMAVAKARVWASEGWQVVITDDDGKTFKPDEFEGLCSFDAAKPRQVEST